MMSREHRIICYLCERENRLLRSGTQSTSIRCEGCGTLLVDVISCPSCGTKNRVKIRIVEHQKVTCGKCRAALPLYQFERVIKQTSASKKNFPNALLIEGKMFQWKGEWESAIQLFQQARKHCPDNPENRVKFSVSTSLCHAYLGNYEKALESLEGIEAMEVEEFGTLYELARAYGLIGEIEYSIFCFEELRELLIDAHSIQHLDSLLSSLYDIRDTDAAGPIALQTTILLYDAQRDYETQHFQAGMQKLQRALELDPMNPTIHHQLGIGFLGQGQFEEAVGLLERGLEFDPMHEQAQFALGDAYFHLGMYECAMNAYKQTLNLNPHNIDAYHHLGLIYEKQGEIELAKGYWEDVLQVNPTHEEALRCLGHYS